MKVAIPTRNNVVDDHFGHCEYYTIFTISEDKLIVCTEIQASPEGCGCKSNIASVLEEKGVELMLAGNMAKEPNIRSKTTISGMIRGCSGSVEAVVNAWLQGALTDSGEACQHHDCPDHHDSGPLTFKVLK